MKKSIWLFFTSFRRKPESSFFTALAIDWTPVFTGVTAEIQFFHTFGEGEGGGDVTLFITFLLVVKKFKEGCKDLYSGQSLVLKF